MLSLHHHPPVLCWNPNQLQTELPMAVLPQGYTCTPPTPKPLTRGQGIYPAPSCLDRSTLHCPVCGTRPGPCKPSSLPNGVMLGFVSRGFWRDTAGQQEKGTSAPGSGVLSFPLTPVAFLWQGMRGRHSPQASFSGTPAGSFCGVPQVP